MTWQLNLAALTEAELLSLYGEDGLQARLPDLASARLQNRPLLDVEIPGQILVSQPSRQSFGVTSAQTRSLADLSAALQEAGAEEGEVYNFPPPQGESFARGYALPDTAALVRWQEGGTGSAGPHLCLLTWLRDKASGMACVMSTNQPQAAAPACSEEIDFHVHTGASVEDLLLAHKQHVQRQGRTQKLASVGGWQEAWQAAHDLNLAAWKRRRVVVETSAGARS